MKFRVSGWGMSGFNQEIDFVVNQSESNISCCQICSNIQYGCQKSREGKITFSHMIINQRDSILLCVLGRNFQNAFRKKETCYLSSHHSWTNPDPFGLMLGFALPLAQTLAGIWHIETLHVPPTSAAGLEQHRLQHQPVYSSMFHFQSGMCLNEFFSLSLFFQDSDVYLWPEFCCRGRCVVPLLLHGLCCSHHWWKGKRLGETPLWFEPREGQGRLGLSVGTGQPKPGQACQGAADPPPAGIHHGDGLSWLQHAWPACPRMAGSFW